MLHLTLTEHQHVEHDHTHYLLQTRDRFDGTWSYALPLDLLFKPLDPATALVQLRERLGHDNVRAVLRRTVTILTLVEE